MSRKNRFVNKSNFPSEEKIIKIARKEFLSARDDEDYNTIHEAIVGTVETLVDDHCGDQFNGCHFTADSDGSDEKISLFGDLLNVLFHGLEKEKCEKIPKHKDETQLTPKIQSLINEILKGKRELLKQFSTTIHLIDQGEKAAKSFKRRCEQTTMPPPVVRTATAAPPKASANPTSVYSPFKRQRGHSTTKTAPNNATEAPADTTVTSRGLGKS